MPPKALSGGDVKLGEKRGSKRKHDKVSNAPALPAPKRPQTAFNSASSRGAPPGHTDAWHSYINGQQGPASDRKERATPAHGLSRDALDSAFEFLAEGGGGGGGGGDSSSASDPPAAAAAGGAGWDAPIAVTEKAVPLLIAWYKRADPDEDAALDKDFCPFCKCVGANHPAFITIRQFFLDNVSKTRPRELCAEVKKMYHELLAQYAPDKALPLADHTIFRHFFVHTKKTTAQNCEVLSDIFMALAEEIAQHSIKTIDTVTGVPSIKPNGVKMLAQCTAVLFKLGALRPQL